MCSAWNPPSWLVGTRDGAATLEDSLAASYKTKHTLSTQSSKRTLRYLSKGAESLCPHKNQQMDVHGSFIHNQNSEAPEMPFSG